MVNQADAPEIEVQSAPIPPPVQDSATARVWPRATRARPTTWGRDPPGWPARPSTEKTELPTRSEIWATTSAMCSGLALPGKRSLRWFSGRRVRYESVTSAACQPWSRSWMVDSPMPWVRMVTRWPGWSANSSATMGSTRCSNIAFISRGTPGMQNSHPRVLVAGMRRPAEA